MKKLMFAAILVFSVCQIALAQEKFITKTGEINFEASVPSFEEVNATNKNVSAILNSNGEFASLALMKGFRFKVALMEEHFNENYVETSKFPKTTFKGNILEFNISELGTEESTYTIKGVINMHGVDKEIEVPATLTKNENTIYINTTFVLKPADFNIEIPSIVSNKIAEEVNVTAIFELKSK